MQTNIPTSIHKQKGVAILTFSLILLIILTMLGTSAINLSTMELKQARSLIEYNRAFQMAETALQQYLFKYESVDDPLSELPLVLFDKPTSPPKDFCLVASYKAVTSPACLTGNVQVDIVALKVGDGVAEIEMKRTNIVNEGGSKFMYVILKSTGYSKDKNDPKAFKVTLNSGLKLPIYITN